MKSVIREKILPVGLFILVLTGLFYLWGTAYARADGTASLLEQQYAKEYANTICAYLDDPANRDDLSIIAIVPFLMDKTGLKPDSAVDIMNYSVQEYCPRNWQLLVELGNRARAQQGKGV